MIWLCESNDPTGQFVTNENRACAYDVAGKGVPDLFWGSGLGRVYFLENLGPGKDGVPRFRNHGPLKDVAGDMVKVFDRCLPNVVPNFFGDGKLWLVVGGSHSGYAGHTGRSDDQAVDPEFREMVRQGLGLPKGEVFDLNIPVMQRAIGCWPHAIKIYEILGMGRNRVPRLGKPIRMDTVPVFKPYRTYPFVVDWDCDGKYEAIYQEKLYKFTGTRKNPGLKYWKRLPFRNIALEHRVRSIFDAGNEGTVVHALDDGTQMIFISQEPFCLHGIRRSFLENRPKAVVASWTEMAASTEPSRRRVR